MKFLLKRRKEERSRPDDTKLNDGEPSPADAAISVGSLIRRTPPPPAVTGLGSGGIASPNGSSSTAGISTPTVAIIPSTSPQQQTIDGVDLCPSVDSVIRPSSTAGFRPVRRASTGTFGTPGGTMKSPHDSDLEARELQESEEWSTLLEKEPLDTVEGLVARLNMCRDRFYDFTQDTFMAAKEKKKTCLLQLVEAVAGSPLFGTEEVMGAMVGMTSANLIRPLPPTMSDNVVMVNGTEIEDDEPYVDAGWPHRQVVYELLLRFVVSDAVDAKQVKKFIDQKFVLRLLELFGSDDSRERDYLKTVLHRIYGKVMALRSFVRRAIQHHFFRFTYEQRDDGGPISHKGIGELLEILGSIINGFALPLKEEHRQYLKSCLIPLHRSRNLHAFNVQLTYCMTQYVEKDSRLAEPVIRGILKYWPVTNTTKEVIFLNELEEILELTQHTEFEKIMYPLFHRLAACIESPHFQVSERVLFLWNNECIVQLFAAHKQELFPLIISSLYKNSKDHWNSTVHGLTYNVSKLLAEADPELFDEVSEANVAAEEERLRTKALTENTWESLEAQFRASTNQAAA